MSITTNALGERAMLVSLSISVWSARKHDARISDKVAAEHGADRSMGRYAKHLIPRDLLAAVNAANTALRDHHNLNTLAWGDDGTRILPAANYLGYQEQQQKLEDAFGRAVQAFVASYPDYVEAARAALNGLFDPKDYPAPGRIRDKFGVRRGFLPVAQPDDFRVRLGDAHVAQIRAEIEARNADLIDSANRELLQRVHDVTSRVVERLRAFEVDPVTGSRAHPFRDSLIENVRALLDLMPRLNITGDAGLERVRHELAETVACHQPTACFQPGDVIDLTPQGGGGTAFRPVFDWVAQSGLDPVCVLYLTDLDGSDFGAAPDYPVLWVSTDRTTAPFGEVIALRP